LSIALFCAKERHESNVHEANVVTSMATARAPLSRRFAVAPMMEWTDRHCGSSIAC